MNFKPNAGIYPTMVTPYLKDGTIDYAAAERMTEWYYENGCDGIFAACQSSEIFYLSLEERVRLAETVVNKVRQLNAQNSADDAHQSIPRQIDTDAAENARRGEQCLPAAGISGMVNVCKNTGGRTHMVAPAKTSTALCTPRKQPMQVVVSRHVSEDITAQAEELSLMHATGADAVILISNRLDPMNEGDGVWLTGAEELLRRLPADVKLGLYECPYPYKRILSERIVRWCAESGRFYFIKSTSCDLGVIASQISAASGSPLKLYNANAQTLLDSLRLGAVGYCGVMANFHPGLYSKFWRMYNEGADAELYQAFFCVSAFLESLAYPVTAKYHLNDIAGIAMEYSSRARDCAELTEYQKSCVRQMNTLAEHLLGLQYCEKF